MVEKNEKLIAWSEAFLTNEKAPKGYVLPPSGALSWK
jgi:hypothetical protein